jgi:protein-disulfide isomerase/uncharacterized membrane protein
VPKSSYDLGLMNARRAAAAIALALAGAALSTLLLLEHHGESLGVSVVQTICGEGASSGCETVARSAYSSVAGVPLAAVGLVFYVSIGFLLGLGTLGSEEVRTAGGQVAFYSVVLALVIDLGLLGIQAIAIKAFCKLCLGTYAVNGLMLATLWPLRRPRDMALSRFLTGEGRIMAGGWASATIAVAAAILALNTTLSYREARRTAGLLGSPASGSPEDAVKRAEAETRRLQEILDDPQKREQYLTEKAVKEFEDATPLNLDLSQAPFSGPANAPIQVVEFSDYLCPYCRGLAAAFKDYLPKSGGRVVIHYKNYPLDKTCNTQLQNTVHDGACWLALGAICSQQLGPFAAYQDKANSTPAKAMTRDDALRIGGEVGIPSTAMGTCLDSPATKARLTAEIEEARRVGVKATPTVFLNGKMLPRVNDFLLAVERETRRLGLTPLTASPH